MWSQGLIEDYDLCLSHHGSQPVRVVEYTDTIAMGGGQFLPKLAGFSIRIEDKNVHEKPRCLGSVVVEITMGPKKEVGQWD
jgi:hypothetical protein